MKTGSKGLALIKRFEGCRLKAYYCPAGVLTIGYGSTGPHVKKGMVISDAEAEALLRKDLVRFESAVSRLVKVPLSQEQFDALVSFAFNCGEGALQKSTLLKRLNRGEYSAVPSELGKWTRAGGTVLPGLVKRRNAEAALWSPSGSAPAIPPPPDIDPSAINEAGREAMIEHANKKKPKSPRNTARDVAGGIATAGGGTAAASPPGSLAFWIGVVVAVIAVGAAVFFILKNRKR